MMITPAWDTVLATLDRHRVLLLGLAATKLSASIPPPAPPHPVTDRTSYHQQQLYETIAQLHDSLQAARVNEALLTHEFAWAGRVLPRWGVSATQAEQLIDCYVSTALTLHPWKPEELEVLEALRGYLHRLARSAFP